MELQQWEQAFTAYIQKEGGNFSDGSHDMGHFRRVWLMCQRIQAMEGGTADLEILVAAAYFHDLVSVPKNHPDRKKCSVLSAEKTGEILALVFPQFPKDKIAGVQHAIEAHSFSAAIPARTAEAKILQDADRMEALGAIGIARTFYTAGFMHSRMFDETDPLGEHRALNDAQFALDHFEVKLLKLPSMMQTVSGRQIATKRAERLVAFRAMIASELKGE